MDQLAMYAQKMTHPVIHIKSSKPMPDKVRQSIKDKKERRMLYAQGDIKAIRDMDSKKNVSILPDQSK